ncbi:phosphotransferase [Propionibacteriaceae bacterium Y1700]|uniref:phosphotransferase enzyme family protein n=1 Tax=Microlunatus sp. Y1700 TaxID=3418487 RepID=UPI003DA7181C
MDDPVVDTPLGRVSELRSPAIGGLVATVRIGRLGDGMPVVVKWAGPHPDSPGNLAAEAVILHQLADGDLPVPRLLHAEPGLTITSWLPGRIDLDRADHDHLGVLAGQLLRLQSVPLAGLAPFESWADPEAVPPPWGDHGLWSEAIALAAESVPAVPADALVLCHRDFHPGNLLITAEKVTGIVDWGNACSAAVDVDVAHMANNLACLHGVDAAVDFVAQYVRRGGPLTGRPHWWAYEIVSWLPDPAHILPPWQAARPDLNPEQVRSRCEGLLAWALRGGPSVL